MEHVILIAKLTINVPIFNRQKIFPRYVKVVAYQCSHCEQSSDAKGDTTCCGMYVDPEADPANNYDHCCWSIQLD